MSACVVTLDQYQINARFAHRDGYRGTIQFSTSYSTGGDTLTPQQFGYGSIIEFLICPAVVFGVPIGVIIDPSTSNYVIKAYAGGAGEGAPLQEYAPGTNLQAAIGAFRFWSAGI